ncbi:hypothetical protein [Undibacterium sp.]|jgi:hypothetical protein|uniref:hypothetical protein n=1 Tax=Undibacterium sp. TaxID=1914977 RepID=UPI002BC5174A|nr:hypothetical protein [Undibacterium sp.]HTD05751.1 hypothetical protein [Undibacterium sp.]
MRRTLGLIWPMIASLLLPLAVAWFVYPTTHLPPGFGVFPPEFVTAAPGFWLLAFIVVLLVEIVIAAFLIKPTWFGFQPVAPKPPAPVTGLPYWFWIGGVLTLFFWWLMWTRITPFGELVYYAFTPLWWGFILVLDGLVYRRNNGNSLLSKRPKTLFISALVSIAGWGVFEYFDYFALGNWYYPNVHIPALSHGMIVFLFIVAYTTVWPAVFEWYTLLNTFPGMVARYSQGPKLALPGAPMLWLGLILIAAMVVFPYPLFWVLWIGPLIILSGQLIRKGVWTPFTAMAQGNWSPMILMALSSLFNGFFWEVWNFGSAHPDPALQTNPNYWIYNIPYVNVIHIFAEMPLEGYFGYLPFGILVWIVFIWAGEVFGFDTDLGVPTEQP